MGKMQKIYESENLNVTKEETIKGKKFIRFKWGRMWLPKEQVVEAHTKAAKIAQQENIDTYVADVYEATPPLKDEVITWWTSWSLFLQKIGIKRIIEIPKKEGLGGEALSRICQDRWKLESKRTGIKHTSAKDRLSIFGEIDKD